MGGHDAYRGDEHVSICSHYCICVLIMQKKLLTNSPDPDPAIFASYLEEVNKKFFCLLLFESTYTSFFKDKKIIKSHKTVGINLFLTIFA